MDPLHAVAVRSATKQREAGRSKRTVDRDPGARILAVSARQPSAPQA